MQDWFDFTPTAIWRNQRPGPPPFKRGVSVPWFVLPHGADPSTLLPDTCHSYHIGLGVDMGASGIVLLAKLGLFGEDRSIDKRLARAFDHYMTWCVDNGRYTSCKTWSKHVLDMQTMLA